MLSAQYGAALSIAKYTQYQDTVARYTQYTQDSHKHRQILDIGLVTNRVIRAADKNRSPVCMR